MAEVRKKVTKDQYNTESIKTGNYKKEKKAVKNEKVKKESEKKDNIWIRFKIFCHGVKSEFDKVHWPSKQDMIKYSIATVVFILFCSLFFYLIEVIFAFVQSLFN